MSNNNLWEDNGNNDQGDPVVALEVANQQLAENMAQHERSILGLTESLGIKLQQLDDIVVAVHKVADFTPQANTDEQRKFWHKTVLPTLIDCLRQDIKARVTIEICFSAIRTLYIVIENNYELIKGTKGSKKAIQNAQISLPNELATLDQAILRAKNLSTNALEKFDEYMPRIYEIIGPEAAKNIEERSKYEQQINERILKQQTYMTKLINLQGTINSKIYMIQAIDKQLMIESTDIEESKRQVDRMKKLEDSINQQMNQTVANIPRTVQKDIQTQHSVGFWLFSWSGTKTETINVENPNRESEIQLHENIARAQTQRVNDNCKTEAKKAQAMKEYREKLEREKATLTSDLKTAEISFNQQADKLNQMLEYEQGKIEFIRGQIAELDAREMSAYNQIGLMGDPLVQCLTNIRIFAKTIHKGASAFQPLVSMLETVKAMVQDDINLLKSDERTDIFVAGQLMMNKGKFLSKYHNNAYKAIQPSMNYKQLELNKDKRLAIE